MQQINLKDLVQQNSVDEIFAKIAKSEQGMVYSEGDAEEIVKKLISKKVNIQKLLNEHGIKLFSGEGKYALLTQFHIQWVGAEHLETDRMSKTFILRNAFANRSNENEVEVDQFLGKVNHLPIDLVDAAMQIPNGVDMLKHIEFLEGLNRSIKKSPKKTELSILVLKNLLEFENYFTRQEASESHKELITKTQQVAQIYRKILIGSDVREMSTLNPAQKKILEKVANNGRLRRAFVRDIVKGLYKDEKLKIEAILGSEGKDNPNKIISLMCNLDYNDMANFNILMAGVIDELQSQHNLDPNLISGSANRWFNWGMSYPIGLMYYVWDCFSAVVEFISVYLQKGAYGVYDWFKGNKEDREIEFNTFSGIKDEIQKIVKQIQTAEVPAVEILTSKLKNDILEFLKDPNAVGAIDALKGKINPDGFSGDLKEKLEELKAKDETSFAKTAYELLQHPQMNQGVEKYLENSWGAAAKGVFSGPLSK